MKSKTRLLSAHDEPMYSSHLVQLRGEAFFFFTESKVGIQSVHATPRSIQVKGPLKINRVNLLNHQSLSHVLHKFAEIW